MRVRMRVTMSGTRDGEEWPPRGAETELPDGEAADLCAAGLAVPVSDTDDTTVETATAPEATERRPARGRSRRTD